MATRNSSMTVVTERVRGLDINSQNQNIDPNKPANANTRPSKLASKYAPNAESSGSNRRTLLRMALQDSNDDAMEVDSAAACVRPPPGRTVTHVELSSGTKKTGSVDIGRYDGGLESEGDEQVPAVIDGEAAKILALDSSVSE
ncbi:hypothetical protein FRB99_003871, partial [Tulasnella sp. 403]